MADTISVLIADDHPMFRIGIRTALSTFQDIECIGEAETGEHAIRMAGQLQPDVILMDVQMPSINGIDAARQIAHMSPHIAILMLTMFDDDISVFASMQAGARGYVLKGAKHAEINRAIHAVYNGEAIFSPSVAARMMDYFAMMRSARAAPVFPKLTDREYEILDLIAAGYKNPEIVERLVLTDKTVRNYVHNILSKLQATDRADVILKAREAGFGKTDP